MSNLYIYNPFYTPRPEVFCKKGVLKNFAKFTGEKLRQSFFNKVTVTCNFLKTRSTTAVDPRHLKVAEDISLPKNCCIAISIQKASLIDKFILKMLQILGSHELTSHGHFSQRPPKNY